MILFRLHAYAFMLSRCHYHCRHATDAAMPVFSPRLFMHATLSPPPLLLLVTVLMLRHADAITAHVAMPPLLIDTPTLVFRCCHRRHYLLAFVVSRGRRRPMSPPPTEGIRITYYNVK